MLLFCVKYIASLSLVDQNYIIDMHVFSCCNIASKETKDCQKEGDKFNNITRTYNHVEGKNEGKTVQGSF
jgi:hypothetical protein